MKAILIDDEPLALQFLEKQLNKFDGIEVIDTFVHFKISEHKQLLNDINVVFLDIEMPEENGLEMAEKLIEINPYLSVVFVTAYNEYAVQAFELNTLDYLLKPVQTGRLQTTVERVLNQKHTINNEDNTYIAHLKVNVSNDITFELNDEVTIVNWRTAKAKELFSYLLLNEGNLIHKADLVDIFWEGFETKKAFPLLYTTVYHIRKALKPFNKFLQLKNEQDGYILLIDNVLIDLIEWERQINKYPSVNDYSINFLEDAMILYTDPYLKNYDYLWADNERFRLESKWVSTALNISNYYFENGKYKQAESWLVEICQTQPENEGAHFLLMRLYDILDYGILVNHEYEKLSENLLELGLSVNDQIQNWYNQWLEHQRPENMNNSS